MSVYPLSMYTLFRRLQVTVLHALWKIQASSIVDAQATRVCSLKIEVVADLAISAMAQHESSSLVVSRRIFGIPQISRRKQG